MPEYQLAFPCRYSSPEPPPGPAAAPPLAAKKLSLDRFPAAARDESPLRELELLIEPAGKALLIVLLELPEPEPEPDPEPDPEPEPEPEPVEVEAASAARKRECSRWRKDSTPGCVVP